MSPVLQLALLAPLLGLGGSPPSSQPARDPTRPLTNEVEVHFDDGSTVRMLILQETIDVVTRYGRLAVPVSDIRRIDFGLHLSDTLRQQIEDAVRKLSSDEFKQREEGGKFLLGLGGTAYPALQRAVKSNDLETARNARELLKRLREKVPEDKLQVKGYDVIQTADFPVSGNIDNPTLKARSPIFGELQLKVAELRGVRWLAGGVDVEVTVDAGKHAVANEQRWMETNVEIPAESELHLTASGEVDLNPGNNGQFSCGPNGWQNGGFSGRHRPGQLVGRIGERGKQFVIGEKYEAVTKEEGKLYLMIGPSPWGANPTGSYKVRVVINR